MSDIKHTILTILREGKEKQTPYPHIFEALKKAGVTAYTVSWQDGNYQSSYEGGFGVVHEAAPAGFRSVTVASVCNLQAAKEALKEVQQKKINFVEWVSRMAAAGISHYYVDMAERTVTYCNSSEDTYFTEHVPTIQ